MFGQELTRQEERSRKPEQAELELCSLELPMVTECDAPLRTQTIISQLVYYVLRLT